MTCKICLDMRAIKTCSVLWHFGCFESTLSTTRTRPRVSTRFAPILRLSMLGIPHAHSMAFTSFAARTSAAFFLAFSAHLLRNITWNCVEVTAYAQIIRCTTLAVSSILRFKSCFAGAGASMRALLDIKYNWNPKNISEKSGTKTPPIKNQDTP